MDYESMYKLFSLNEEDMAHIDALTRKARADYAIRENVIVTTLVYDKNGTQVVNKEVVDAELV